MNKKSRLFWLISIWAIAFFFCALRFWQDYQAPGKVSWVRFGIPAFLLYNLYISILSYRAQAKEMERLANQPPASLSGLIDRVSR